MSDVIIRDTITPYLESLTQRLGQRMDILRAVGTIIVSVAQRAFTSPDLRPAPWKPTQTGRPPLYKTGMLRHSIRVADVTADSVTVATDRPYAAYHQLGVEHPWPIAPRRKKALANRQTGWGPYKKAVHPGLPPRPFFPFDASGRLIPYAAEQIKAVLRDVFRAGR